MLTRDHQIEAATSRLSSDFSMKNDSLEFSLYMRVEQQFSSLFGSCRPRWELVQNVTCHRLLPTDTGLPITALDDGFQDGR